MARGTTRIVVFVALSVAGALWASSALVIARSSAQPLATPSTSGPVPAFSVARETTPTGPVLSAEAQGLHTTPIAEGGPFSDWGGAPSASAPTAPIGGSVSQMISVEVPCARPELQNCAAAQPTRAGTWWPAPARSAAFVGLATACASLRRARRRTRSGRPAARPLVV